MSPVFIFILPYPLRRLVYKYRAWRALRHFINLQKSGIL